MPWRLSMRTMPIYLLKKSVPYWKSGRHYIFYRCLFHFPVLAWFHGFHVRLVCDVNVILYIESVYRAANHSAFGRIFPHFRPFSAIPRGIHKSLLFCSWTWGVTWPLSNFFVEYSLRTSPILKIARLTFDHSWCLLVQPPVTVLVTVPLQRRPVIARALVVLSDQISFWWTESSLYSTGLQR